MSLSPGSPGTLFPVVPVSPASPPRVSVHCRPGTPLGSPQNCRRAVAVLFATMSLRLGGPSSGGGGGAGRAPAPRLLQRPLGQQCMLDSEPHPLGLHGNASAVPALLESINAQCCHRFPPTGHSAGLGPGPQGPRPGLPLGLLPPRSRGGGKGELSAGQEPSSWCGGKPAMVRPRGQNPIPFLTGTLG